MRQVPQLLGFVGTVTVAIGYLPQILHLAREHCSAGVSVRAWQIWLLSSVLIFAHALEVLDPVFLTLQTVNSAAIISIIALSKRYQGMTCATHRSVAHQTTDKG